MIHVKVYTYKRRSKGRLNWLFRESVHPPPAVINAKPLLFATTWWPKLQPAFKNRVLVSACWCVMEDHSRAQQQRMRGGGSSGGTSGSGCRDRTLLESSLLGTSKGICGIMNDGEVSYKRTHFFTLACLLSLSDSDHIIHVTEWNSIRKNNHRQNYKHIDDKFINETTIS